MTYVLEGLGAQMSSPTFPGSQPNPPPGLGFDRSAKLRAHVQGVWRGIFAAHGQVASDRAVECYWNPDISAQRAMLLIRAQRLDGQLPWGFHAATAKAIASFSV